MLGLELGLGLEFELGLGLGYIIGNILGAGQFLTLFEAYIIAVPLND